jgi:hypothetical protein
MLPSHFLGRNCKLVYISSLFYTNTCKLLPHNLQFWCGSHSQSVGDMGL